MIQQQTQINTSSFQFLSQSQFSSQSFDQIEAKLQSPKFYDKIEAIERISQLLQSMSSSNNQNSQVNSVFINSLILKLADFYRSKDTTNKIRLYLLQHLISPHHRILEQHVYNKEEFTTRVSYLLHSNDPQSRIISLQLFSQLPSFIQKRLDIQHKIIAILTSTHDQRERMVANQTIWKLSKGSEIFAQSILNKVQETVLSGQFNQETCYYFITAIQNVQPTSSNANFILITIKNIYERIHELYGDKLDSALLLTLLQMIYKAPIIMQESVKFLLEIECYEGIELVSRKYPLQSDVLELLCKRLVEDGNNQVNIQDKSDKDLLFMVSTLVNSIFVKNIPSNVNIEELRKTLCKVQQRINIDVVSRHLIHLSNLRCINKLLINQILFLTQTTNSSTLLRSLPLNNQLNLFVSLSEYQIIQQQKLRNIGKSQVKNQQLDNIIDILSQSIDKSQAKDLQNLNLFKKYSFYKCQLPQQQNNQSQLEDQIVGLIEIINSKDESQSSQTLRTSLRNMLRLISNISDDFLQRVINGANLKAQLIYEVIVAELLKRENSLSQVAYSLSSYLEHISKEHSLAANYLRLLQKYLSFLVEVQNSLNQQIINQQTIESYLLQIQSLKLESVSILSKWDFLGKDLMEARDIIQGDSTNDPFRYFMMYQWFGLVESILEYKSFQNVSQNELSSDQINQDELTQMKTEYYKTILSQIRYIEKCQGVSVSKEPLNMQTLNDQVIDKILNTLPTDMMYFKIPPFMIIKHEYDPLQASPHLQFPSQQISASQDEIQVKKEQDFVAQINLQLSSCSKTLLKGSNNKTISLCSLNWTLIQNHAQQFQVQSSQVIDRNEKIIKLMYEYDQSINDETNSESDQSIQNEQMSLNLEIRDVLDNKRFKTHCTENLLLNFPTIGQYILRLETRLLNKHEKPMGVEIVKHLKFRVN